MNKRLQSHFFWGPYGPFSALTAAALFIMASVRLSYAIICAGAVLWVFGLTALVYFSAAKIMPAKGRPIILLFLSSLLCSIYILLTGLANPLLVNATWFYMVLIPPCCIGSGLFEEDPVKPAPANQVQANQAPANQVQANQAPVNQTPTNQASVNHSPVNLAQVNLAEILPRVCLEALCLGIILIAFSLIREPLGSGSLSLPGGPWGFFNIFGENSTEPFAVQVISVSAGGFILLGFSIALFRFFKGISGERS